MIKQDIEILKDIAILATEVISYLHLVQERIQDAEAKAAAEAEAERESQEWANANPD